jgi:hypothetical protein
MVTFPHVRRMGIAATCALIASVLFGMAPAHAAEPGITLLPGGALHARGAAIVVEATLTCPAGQFVVVNVAATQVAADGSLVRGLGQRGVSCTGAAMTRRLSVSSADPRFTGVTTGRPFTAGAAFVTASFQWCDEVRCETETHSRSVQAASGVTMNAAQFTSSSLVMSLPAQATLEAAGAGVLVRVPYRCATSLTGAFQAVLIERTSTTAVTSSSAGNELTCSGVNRTGVLSFHAESAAWKKGTAFIILNGDVCGGQGCLNGYAHRTLTLV